MEENRFYAYPGWKDVCTDYEEVKRRETGVSLGRFRAMKFAVKEEAEAYRQGMWNTYFKENIIPTEIAADAIIYTDGSYDTNGSKGEKGYASYGLVIFFRTGEIWCESGFLEDADVAAKPEDETGTFWLTRYDAEGSIIEKKEIAYTNYYQQCTKKDKTADVCKFVKPSYNNAGECMGAIQGLEICVREKGLKNIKLVCDCDTVSAKYENEKGKMDWSGAAVNVGVYTAEFIDKLKREYPHKAGFIEVFSHSKHSYSVKDKDFVHAVYNDLTDALAKAEIKSGGNEIDRNELNTNLARAISNCELRKFAKGENRRIYVRGLYREVIEKIRPVFV